MSRVGSLAFATTEGIVSVHDRKRVSELDLDIER